MRSFFTPLFLLATATLTFSSPSPSSSSTVAKREDAKPSQPRGPLPARQRKHYRTSHKKASAASSRAKRTHIVEERQIGDDDPTDTVESLLASLTGGTSGLPIKRDLPTLSLLDLGGLLSTCTSGMTTHQAAIQKAAKRARTYKESHMSSPFQNSVFQELKAYRGSAAGLPGLQQLDATLKPLGPDQGLANFNRNDPIQVLLRTTITSLQDTLEAVDLIVFYIPILGPVLGPIVYDIKCIIDDILNIGEVVLDGLLNNLSPQLSALSGQYLVSVCKMGPSLPVC